MSKKEQVLTEIFNSDYQGILGEKVDKIKMNIASEVLSSLNCIHNDNQDLMHRFQHFLPEDLTDKYVKDNHLDSMLHAIKSEVRTIEKLLKLLK